MKTILFALIVSIATLIKAAIGTHLPQAKLWSDSRGYVVHDTFVIPNGDIFFAAAGLTATSDIIKLTASSNYGATLIAGGGSTLIPNGVPALSANLGWINSLTGTPSGDIMYAASSLSLYIYKIDAINHIVTVLMGTGTKCALPTPDGIVNPQTISLCGPNVVVEYDRMKSVLYYYDEGRRHIRSYNPLDSKLKTIVGFADGRHIFNPLATLRVNESGVELSNFYVARDGIFYGTNYFGGVIRRMIPDGIMTNVPWGIGPQPRAITSDPWGTFYVTYSLEDAMKTVNATGFTSSYHASSEAGMSALFCDDNGHLYYGGFQGFYVAFNSSIAPSWAPTRSPTRVPSRTPSWSPTRVPSSPPTRLPTMPTYAPSAIPTTESPTPEPSQVPSAIPTEVPTPLPSSEQTYFPFATPSTHPSFAPSKEPTVILTVLPSSTPSSAPSNFCEASCNTLDKASRDAVLVASAAQAIADDAVTILATLSAALQELTAKVVLQTAVAEAAAVNAATAAAHAQSLSDVVEHCGEYIVDYKPAAPSQS